MSAQFISRNSLFFRRCWKEKRNHPVNKTNSWQTTSDIYIYNKKLMIENEVWLLKNKIRVFTKLKGIFYMFCTGEKQHLIKI